MAASGTSTGWLPGSWRGGMRRNMKRIVLALALAAVTVVAMSCNSVNRETSPVKLIVTNNQTLQQIDLAGGTNCNHNVATVTIQSVLLQTQSSTPLPRTTRSTHVPSIRIQSPI